MQDAYDASLFIPIKVNIRDNECNERAVKGHRQGSKRAGKERDLIGASLFFIPNANPSEGK